MGEGSDLLPVLDAACDAIPVEHGLTPEQERELSATARGRRQVNLLRICETPASRGKTQGQLAEMAGVGLRTLQYWLANDEAFQVIWAAIRRPRADTLWEDGVAMAYQAGDHRALLEAAGREDSARYGKAAELLAMERAKLAANEAVYKQGSSFQDYVDESVPMGDEEGDEEVVASG